MDGVCGVNALQLILDDLSIDPDDRLRAIIDTLIDEFLPRLADQACLDLHELQTALAIELALTAGSVLKPESALQFAAMITDAIHTGATLEAEGQGVDDVLEPLPIGSLH